MPQPLPDIDPADLAPVPLERAETIPSTWYTDPRFHALEREAVFGRSWQYIADRSALAAPGHVVVVEVAGGRAPSTRSSMCAATAADRSP